jgi:hypothetical protein
VLAKRVNVFWPQPVARNPASPFPCFQQSAHSMHGIRLHIAEAGEGPPVILCHGWPEPGYSWPHQLPVLAAAGFHAVAPDMRSYGRSDAPEDVSAYTALSIAGTRDPMHEYERGGAALAPIQKSVLAVQMHLIDGRSLDSAGTPNR